jgi:hypothetical protein
MRVIDSPIPARQPATSGMKNGRSERVEMTETYDYPDTVQHVAVLRKHGQFSLVATGPIESGTVLFAMEGILTESPTRYTVQLDRALHLDMPDSYGPDEIMDRFYWRFMNHSCDPNSLIRGREVIALKRIEPHQEITFSYNTTEYEMAEAFDCQCGSANCAGQVAGFRFLPRSERERLRPWLADHLLAVSDESPETPAAVAETSL